ncbi:hypothetical protein D3C80_1592870 [compost metagenome]
MGLPQWYGYRSEEYTGNGFDKLRFFVRRADEGISLCPDDLGTSGAGRGLRPDSQYFQRMGDALVRSSRGAYCLFLCGTAAAVRIPGQGLQRVCDLRRFWSNARIGLLFRADR